MRVAIREQLVALVTIAVLLALMVVSVPTWIYVHDFVVNVRKEALALTASLKASRISADLELVQANCLTIASRLLIQEGFKTYYNRSTTQDWSEAAVDLQTALSASDLTGLLQARLYPRTDERDAGGVVNVTGSPIPRIRLPYNHTTNGSAIFLDDGSRASFPKELYPNITYRELGTVNEDNNQTEWEAWAFDEIRLGPNGGLLLGPLVVNDSFALMSVTIPVRDNANTSFVLGYLTVVAMATSLINIAKSREGLGDTGLVLLVGPMDTSNRFNSSVLADNSTFKQDPNLLENVEVHYLLPANPLPGQQDRHSERSYVTGSDDSPFILKNYPAALKSFTGHNIAVNNASSMLSTTNEQGVKVAVGFARTINSLANWTVIVEQAREEAYVPIKTLRKILLGCVFGTAGLIFLLTYPCAHLGVMPIQRLKRATEKTVQPPGYEESYFESDLDEGGDGETPGSGHQSQRSRNSKKGPVAGLLAWLGLGRKRKADSEHSRDLARRTFKIPGKVADRGHFIVDELTELTRTFNDMSDELVKQYTSLDEKVALRTRELEISKKAAEAANESKTLFIANISHELKTPLNGILGMCAVCMEESDIGRIKQSLRTLYKSGDLLLHLLEDLLSFSKNQIGQQLSLEEKEFRLADIRSQILTIFDKQVREGLINFSVTFLSSDNLAGDANNSTPAERLSMDRTLPALGPLGTGRLKDMCLWGDQHRILQVIINLVSNSLKFTPKGGRVEVRIRCLGEVDEASVGVDGSRASSFSKGSGRRTRGRVGSSSNNSTSSRGGGPAASSSAATAAVKGTAISINPMDPKATPHIHIRERSPTPPPPNAKSFLFEFEVEDTGPGIPEHMQPRVFEPFVQADLGLSKKFGGTGLGLSICQQLANIMGGAIELQSTVGVGTTFTMTIPLKYVKDRASSTASSSVNSRPPSVDAGEGESVSNRNSAVKSGGDSKSSVAVFDPQPRLVGLRQPFFAATPALPPPQTAEDKMATVENALAKKDRPGKLRVLVADDNSTNIEVVSKMLKLEDIYDVTIAKDGQEAYDMVKVAMAANEQFDVIFMDVQMPNLDGLQSTRLIREMGYTSPIVALTAFSEESNVKECMESGMDEFLSKPIRRPALKQVLKKFATIPEEPETEKATKSEDTNNVGSKKAIKKEEKAPSNGAV